MLPRLSRLAVLIAVVAMATCVADKCNADCWGNDFGYGPYGYFTSRIGSSPYGLGRIPTPPYFALHPPVYYSYPVPRPYGFSPFPYPGPMMTPPILDEVVEPAIIENPHVEGAESTQGTGMKTPAAKVQSDDGVAEFGPQVIVNPYVVPGASSSQWVRNAR